MRAFNRICQGNKTPQKCTPPRPTRAAKLSLPRSRCRWSLVHMRFELVTLRRNNLHTRSSERGSSNFQLQQKSDIGQCRQLWTSWQWSRETGCQKLPLHIRRVGSMKRKSSRYASTVYPLRAIIRLIASKHHWWGSGSKWETLIIEVGGVFWVAEAPRHSCISPAVGVCANASACMF